MLRVSYVQIELCTFESWCYLKLSDFEAQYLALGVSDNVCLTGFGGQITDFFIHLPGNHKKSHTKITNSQNNRKQNARN